MTGTILSTILCSLGQRSLGPQSGWVGVWAWAQSGEEVPGKERKRLYHVRACGGRARDGARPRGFEQTNSR